MTLARPLLPAFLASLLACSSPTDSTVLARIVVGTIDAGGTLEHVISAPDTVVVGQVTSLTVFTFGDSCIDPAGTEVMVQGAEATITPYDQQYLFGTCRDILKPYAHTARIRFDQAGSATIQVRGRSLYNAGVVTVQHQVVVVP